MIYSKATFKYLSTTQKVVRHQVISNFKLLMSIIMNKLYGTCRIHFCLHACLKLEFKINICLHQVGAIKRDSLNGSKKLERRGKKITAWMSTLAYRIIRLSNFKCCQIEFLIFRKKLKYAFMQVFHDQVQRFC